MTDGVTTNAELVQLMQPQSGARIKPGAQARGKVEHGGSL